MKNELRSSLKAIKEWAIVISTILLFALIVYGIGRIKYAAYKTNHPTATWWSFILK